MSLNNNKNDNNHNNNNNEDNKDENEQNKTGFIRLKRKRFPPSSNNNNNIFVSKPRAECSNPLDRLCEKLLDWDILIDNNNNNNNNNSNDNNIQDLKDVSDTFSSYSEYISIWEPLFIKETQASIFSSLSLEENYGKCRIIPLDLDEKYSSIIKFQCLFGIDNINSNRFPSPQVMSLIIFSSSSVFDPRTKSFVKILPLESSYFLGIVTSQFRGNEVYVSVLKKQFLQFLSKDTNAANQKAKYDSKRSLSEKGSLMFQLEYRYISGLTSQWREFLALHEAYRSPILPIILNPLYDTNENTSTPLLQKNNNNNKRYIPRPPSDPPPPTLQSSTSTSTTTSTITSVNTFEETYERWRMDGVGDAFNKYLQIKYNDSQLRAIRNCVETMNGFSLIQGPPGTGKTSTILGLLNAVHVRDYNRYFEALLQNILGSSGLQCREKGLDPIPWVSLISSLSISYAKPHLLVVAPSNVAVDNIIERIIEKGFRDSSGSLYYPNILRIGSGSLKNNNNSSSCRSITLEESVDNMLNTNGTNCHTIDQQLTENISSIINSILQLQTILLNLKLCWESHPVSKGWELRINQENGRPYWVDHINKCTQLTPPLPPLPGEQYVSDFTLQTLPEYKFFTHLIVQKLEELRLLHLRKVRVRLIIEWTGNQSTRIKSNGGTYRSGNSINSLRHSLETSFIEEADIVFTTLNSSGHPCLEGSTFPVVIIDEAAQCVEPSILIPLRMGCKQCILVGDQQQLSATIFSKTLSRKGYDKSLFERLDKIRSLYGTGSIMLDTQYRMLPEISKFPSKKFYSSILKDGENVKTLGYGPKYLGAPQITDSIMNLQSFSSSYHYYLKPFLFFDLISSQDCIGDTNSRLNIEEVKLCVQLVKFIITESRRAQTPLGSIGIITPYQEQLNEMKRYFIKSSLIPPIEGINTNSIVDIGGNILSNNSNKVNKNARSSINQDKKITYLEEGEVSDDETSINTTTSSTYINNINDEKFTLYEDIELNTVDAFQGREKDIVIISCVRANDMGSIGFLSDTRRMNVAITRARFGLYIIGNANTLKNNQDWNDLILHAGSENRLISLINSNDDILQSLKNNFPIQTNDNNSDNNNSSSDNNNENNQNEISEQVENRKNI